MSPYLPVPDQSVTRRPTVSRPAEGPEGRQFTVSFAPGQRLPAHRNAARVVISAVEGSGEITIEGQGTLALPQGASVQLEPDVEHAVAAGEDGLELVVRLVRPCCEHC